MKWIRTSFPYRLYQTDKLLFAVVGIYVLGLAYGWRLDREEFPFLLYGMYSLKEESKATYSTYSIEFNGKELDQNSLLNPKKELLMTTTAHVVPLMDSVLKGEDKESFARWLLRCGAIGNKMHHDEVNIYKMKALYDESGRINLVHHEAIFSYADY
ncbi:MAG: hypothetical protein IPP77_03265 [Bacteroidetes bacterium]|nr:hypothetical protein [Bacteroidota bacterium]